MRGAFAASKVDVRVTTTSPARHLPEIEAIITASALPPAIQARALRIFRRMIAAEAAIHNAPVESVHLHELGALDTIVDVTGVLLGPRAAGGRAGRLLPRAAGPRDADRLARPHAAAGAGHGGAAGRRAGSGRGPCAGDGHAHRGCAHHGAGVRLRAHSRPCACKAVGYGAGTRTTPEPNILRVLLGEAAASTGLTGETLDLLETNIDDMNPEIYGYLVERLLAAGALDAYLTPVIMKKNRPAVEVSVALPA